MAKRKKIEVWSFITIGILLLFLLFLAYPLIGLFKQSVLDGNGSFTLDNFAKFFSQVYYTSTIGNSFKVTICTTIIAVLIAIPLSYFYSFYKMKGAKLIFVISLLSCMSAPFIGAYSWISLLGRNGAITKFLSSVFGIEVGSIYGFGGILLVQCLKFFPLVFIYMNGAFKNIDNSLLEASANLGCTGIRRLYSVILKLTMPTILAAALLVFMRAFADFGTPVLIGEGYMTFPVLIYRQYVGETGTDFGFAAAISVIAICVTAAVFFAQKWATSKFAFSINALHPVEKKEPKGVLGVLMHVYAYGLLALAFMPQVYVIYLSFRKCKNSIFQPGFSLDSYRLAAKKLLGRSTFNTLFLGITSLLVIVVFAVLISYLVVRRKSAINNAIDTMAMIPYIMPGAVIGIALLSAFSKKPFTWNGTAFIMIVALVIRRLPYTVRSATATLMQIPMSIEEAAISLGASKLKTLAQITVPMMANGILSGAILSWVAIVTEVSSAIILYNNQNITLTMSAYVAISRGSIGLAAAFSTVLTVITTASLLLYLAVSKSEDIRL